MNQPTGQIHPHILEAVNGKDIAKISQKDCNDWAARYGKEYSPTRYNGALGIVRRIFEIAIEHGYRVDNPAKFVDRPG